MTDRFKNKCFNKDATSDLQQALHWNTLKKKKVCVCGAAYFHHYHSSFVETAVNSYTSLLLYFEVWAIGCNSPAFNCSL